MHWYFGSFRCTSWTLGVQSLGTQSTALQHCHFFSYIKGNAIDLLRSVLFAYDVGLASERVSKLQKVFYKCKKILEDHGLRVSLLKIQYMSLPSRT